MYKIYLYLCLLYARVRHMSTHIWWNRTQYNTRKILCGVEAVRSFALYRSILNEHHAYTHSEEHGVQNIVYAYLCAILKCAPVSLYIDTILLH